MVQLTQTNGTITKNYDYDAFGIEKNIDQNDTNPFRYCGEYYDTETGTIYLRARYYDPSVGRFITEDSYLGKIEDPLSLNLYLYCHGNPISYYDPTGRGIKEVWNGFWQGIINYAFASATENNTLMSEMNDEDFMETMSTEEGVASHVGYQYANFANTHDFMIDVTVSGTVGVININGAQVPLDVAIGYTYVMDNTDDFKAHYVHVGGGTSVSLSPLGASVTIGMVDNVSKPSDYADPFWDISANGFIGIDKSFWPNGAEAMGITFSSNPSVSGRYDYYILIPTDEGFDIYEFVE